MMNVMNDRDSALSAKRNMKKNVREENHRKKLSSVENDVLV